MQSILPPTAMVLTGGMQNPPYSRFSRPSRRDLRPLVPGGTVHISVKEVSSIVVSQKFDSSELAVLEKLIKRIERDGKVDVTGLLRTLHLDVGYLDSALKTKSLLTFGTEGLQKQARDDRDRIQRIYNRIAPVFCLPSKIPPEILIHIFIACLPHNPRPLANCAPILLCSVCVTWRQIALHTPELWQSITLRHPPHSAKLPLVVRRWFEHAGDWPVTLRFEKVSWYHFGPHASPLGPRNLLHKVANLELLDLAVGANILRQLQVMLNVGNIHRLSLRTPSPLDVAVVPPFPFPNLRKLILSHNVEPSGQFIIGPAPNLTHLCISGRWLSLEMWSSIIRECTSLQHGLFVIDKSHVVPTPHAFATLKELISLKIILYADGHPHLFDCLSFPSLQTFSIGYNREAPGPWHSRYLTPVRVDKLRSLVLFGLAIPPKELMALLKAASSLQSVVLDVPFRSSALFKVMRIDRSSAVFLPRLSRFTIYHCPRVGGNFHTFDQYGFMNFVKSRWECCSGTTSTVPGPFKCARISFVSVRTERKDPRIEGMKLLLENLKRRGLRVCIGVSSRRCGAGTNVEW